MGTDSFNTKKGSSIYKASLTREQFHFYEMMKQSHLVWDFMITVIGEKYSLRDTAFGKIDLNVFFMRLQEQDDVVATCVMTQSTLEVLVRPLFLKRISNCTLPQQVC